MGIRPTKKPYEFLPSLDGERLQDYTSPKSAQQKRRSLPRGANGDISGDRRELRMAGEAQTHARSVFYFVWVV